MTALPSLYLSHGSPMIALEPGAAGRFMQRLGPAIDATFGRPRAVVVMSPHTATRSSIVLGASQHETIHDFGGFPAPLYEVRYDAPGSPAVAREVMNALAAADLPIQGTPQGGLDHGIWTTLMHLYPQADVPVVPLSLVPTMKPAQVQAIGRALRGLREQGVLVVGSGSLTHNLRRFFTEPAPEDAPETPDCAAFRAWVLDKTQARDWDALRQWGELAPHARAMHPSDDHWLPIYFAAGAGETDADASSGAPEAVRLHSGVTYGHLAMDAYGFGPEACALVQALQ